MHAQPQHQARNRRAILGICMWKFGNKNDYTCSCAFRLVGRGPTRVVDTKISTGSAVQSNCSGFIIAQSAAAFLCRL